MLAEIRKNKKVITDSSGLLLQGTTVEYGNISNKIEKVKKLLQGTTGYYRVVSEHLILHFRIYYRYSIPIYPRALTNGGAYTHRETSMGNAL